MKKVQKRLTLGAETLRNLEVGFKQVAGGFPSQYCSDGSSCCSQTCGIVCTKFNC